MIQVELLGVPGATILSQLWGPFEVRLIFYLRQYLVDWVLEHHVYALQILLTFAIGFLSPRLLSFLSFLSSFLLFCHYSSLNLAI